MAGSQVIRNAGQTVRLDVTSTAHAAVLIDDNTNDQINYTAFLNFGTTPIAIKFGQTSSMGAPTFPADGTNGDYVIPPLMSYPIILATPTTPYYIRAICSGSDTGTLYVTPAADQS